jgi:septum formation protein
MGIPPLVLASASPARLRLLQQAGLSPTVQPSNFDEDALQITDADVLVRTLAQGKAGTVAQRFTDSLILGCDSVLLVAGEIHGKPKDATEAIARWQLMRGKTGELYTGHALIDQVQHKTLIRSRVTRVYFAEVSDRQIEAYVATGEPLKCAGCFALEGQGSLFVEGIDGCHTNVIGLSMPLLRQMFTDLGYDITDCWA